MEFLLFSYKRLCTVALGIHWFKADFLLEILEILNTQYGKDNYASGEIEPI